MRMRRRTISRIAASLFVLATAPAFGLDLNLDLGIANRYYYRYASEPGPRLESEASLGQALGDLYLGADAWSSSAIGDAAALLLKPEEEDLSLNAEYAFGPASAGATGTIYARASGTSYDAGAYARASAPLFGDIASLDGEIRAVAGFPGLYAEARLGPCLSLPLAKPLSLSLQGRLGYLAFGYGGLSYSGFSTLMLQAEATILLDRSVSAKARGGYSFDLSGGCFTPYPFFGIVLGVSASSEAE